MRLPPACGDDGHLAPVKGLVWLDGTITAYDGFLSSVCGDCAVSTG
jgi:hypothetical protein